MRITYLALRMMQVRLGFILSKKMELFMSSLKNLYISFFLTLLAIAPLVHSQAPGYEPPRTEYGVPDLQGIWTNRSITRMERNPLIDDGLVNDYGLISN